MKPFLMALSLLAVLFAMAPAALAETVEIYPLATEEDQERFRNLTKELRCPKCQNQNIADSNAPIAKDMRDAVYRLVRDGAEDDEVVNAMVSRFGEFVRYKPRFEPRTLMLWATPALVILGGLMIVAGIVIRSRRHEEQDSLLTEDQRRAAERILDRSDDR